MVTRKSLPVAARPQDADRRLLLPFMAAMGFVTSMLSASEATAALPGGTLDPNTIPQYVSPLFIPPQMPKSTKQPCKAGSTCPATDYNIAVRQFRQQILPTSMNVPATPVWGYGLAQDPSPTTPGPWPASTSSFSFPTSSIESTAGTPVTVRWMNELVAIDPSTGLPYPVGDSRRTFLPHLISGSVDPSLHWANPGKVRCKMSGLQETDCEPDPAALAADSTGQLLPYTGPVPIVTHLHGSAVNSPSDGYSEAWWLPEASNIPVDYARKGKLYDQFHGNGNLRMADLSANAVPGSAAFAYENDQPATTLYFHDHTIGLTRQNVYAGPTGFFLVRGGAYGDQGVKDSRTGKAGKLPGSGAGGRPTNPRTGGCDPNVDATCRSAIREIPIAIQDRAFNQDGTFFYPDNRDFFEGFGPDMWGGIPHIPDPRSDIAHMYNPEVFTNTMVVNGQTWPMLKVAPQRYRLRILNITDSRALGLAMYTIPPVQGAGGKMISNPRASTTGNDPNFITHAQLMASGTEQPFYQIGSDQGFLPKVQKIKTAVTATPDGAGGWNEMVCNPLSPPSQDPLCQRNLLLGPAQRADVIVDFNGLPAGTIVRMINTAPDSPFGGFPVDAMAQADERTTGQVMQFVVGPAAGTDSSTPPAYLRLPAEPASAPATTPATRKVALMEFDSDKLCVYMAPDETITGFAGAIDATYTSCDKYKDPITGSKGVPYGPRQTKLARVDDQGVPHDEAWMDPISATPRAGSTEVWEIYNTTVDAHPIHIHLVEFKVLGHRPMDLQQLKQGKVSPDKQSNERGPEAGETGFIDTVVALPGEVTRVQAKFVKDGLYMWHCHILEHEDHEMMVPFCTGNAYDPVTGQCKAPDAGATVPAVPALPGL